MDEESKQVRQQLSVCSLPEPKRRSRFAGEPMRKRESKTLDLRAELGRVLQAGKLDHALELYELIEKRKPDEARWPHRRGDLLHRMGRRDEAVAAYERAVELHATKGFVERAAATARLMLAIDATRTDVLERLEVETAAPLSRSPLDESRVVGRGHRAAS